MSKWFEHARQRAVPRRRPCQVGPTLATALLLSTGMAWAQAPGRVFSNPPLERSSTLKVLQAPGAGLETSPIRIIPREGTEPSRYDFELRYTEGKIANPRTGGYDTVKLRAYKGTQVDPSVPFVAPIVEMHPGETVRFTLRNNLPPEPDCSTRIKSINVPHCFNSTNLHSHGLWISPSGNSDNVLISIKPGVSFQYEYNIPEDHPAGTFWYHPHHHGSTALQVSSGMAGALLIRANRPPTSTSPGDIDTLLKYPDSKAADPSFIDRVFLFQQIQYACTDPSRDLTKNPINPKDSNDPIWNCKTGQVGTIDNYNFMGLATWKASGRYTTVNGKVQPRIDDVVAGRLERWRFIHAGVRETLRLKLKALKSGASDISTVRADKQQQWINTNCTGEELAHHEFALDGLTRDRIRSKQVSVLQPGYREDALVVFPKKGQYCVLDEEASKDGTLSTETEGRRLLAIVNVTQGQDLTVEPRAYLKGQLKAAADKFLPEEVREQVKASLEDDLSLPAFVWHKDIEDKERPGKQFLSFDIQPDPSNNPVFMIDNRAYDPARQDRILLLGSADEWTLTSKTANHPFHIHVNPFQVVSILGPEDPTNARSPIVELSGNSKDPDYANLKGAWKDTIFVKQGYTVKVRSRYERYIGDFVLHCHILDHEDNGMMQNVRVALPDGEGGTATAHGHH